MDKTDQPVSAAEIQKSDKNPILLLIRVLQGALIGGGAILPGVSGGVLAVVFGVYRPMMELLSHPFRSLKKHLWLFIPIIIGVGLGFIGFAKLMALLFKEGSPYPISVFVGLILGTVPVLLTTAKSQGTKPADYKVLWLTFAGLLAFLLIIKSLSGMTLFLNPAWSFVSGIIWGFSLVIPGLSSSSLLIFMGLYTQIMADVGQLQLSTVLPLLLGIAAVAVLFAKLVDRLFQRHFSLASHAIVGLVLASTVMIVPLHFESLQEGLLSLLLAVIGFAAAFYLGVWGRKYEAQR